MNPVRCMIVDDEPLAQRVLEKYIAMLPSLTLVKACDNAIEALSYIHTNQIDLMFLDIKMPQFTGIDLLKSTHNLPCVIITSAYSEYALDGYEFDVTDYLLKPFSFERFVKAVNKAVQRLHSATDVPKNEASEGDSISVKTDEGYRRIQFEEILYISAYGNYIKIHTGEKEYLTQKTMQAFEELLPKTCFVRVHKSYIVACSKIKKVEKDFLYIEQEKIPIGASYRMLIRSFLTKN